MQPYIEWQYLRACLAAYSPATIDVVTRAKLFEAEDEGVYLVFLLHIIVGPVVSTSVHYIKILGVLSQVRLVLAPAGNWSSSLAGEHRDILEQVNGPRFDSYETAGARYRTWTLGELHPSCLVSQVFYAPWGLVPYIPYNYES